MPGANDPDNRRMMRFDWNELEDSTYRVVRKLIELRKNHMALLYGNFEFLEKSNDFLVYHRSYYNDNVVVVFNKSGQPVRYEGGYGPLKERTSLMGNTIEWKGADDYSVVIPPYSFDIFTSK